MAKRTKKNVGKGSKKEIVVDEDKLKKLFEDLSKEDNSSKSELEENIELSRQENIEIEDFNFEDFQKFSGSSPVLERIAGSEPRPIFVGGIPQGQNAISGEDKESDPFKYSAGNPANNGEPKYVDSDSKIRGEIERVDLSKVGRDFEAFHAMNPEQAFIQSREASFESPSQERLIDLPSDNARTTKRKSPMEEDYRKYSPDLPKSR